MEIKVIEVFPKAKWFINILRKKYPEEVLEEAFKKLESNLKSSEAKA